jgi:sugar-specific transcriptional regulator TrmB
MEEKLRKIGLTKSEVKIYLYLLEVGTSSPPQIAKGTGITRSNCYDVFRKLRERNLIESHKKGSRKNYSVKDPLALVQYEENRLQNIQQLLPELRNMYDSKKNKPNIRFLEGFDQVKQIWTESLKSDHIRGITSTKKLYTNSPKFFNDYHKQLNKKNILLQDILTSDSKGAVTDWTKNSIGPMYEMRFLPKKYLTLPTDILIWNESVALIHITHPVSATIFTEKSMADTFRILFDLSWKQLHKQPR